MIEHALADTPSRMGTRGGAYAKRAKSAKRCPSSWPTIHQAARRLLGPDPRPERVREVAAFLRRCGREHDGTRPPWQDVRIRGTRVWWPSVQRMQREAADRGERLPW
jgi:hypothetical protein